jgi:rubrerythrin
MMTELDLTKLDLRDALDLAILIEEEAKDRYATLTKWVGGQYAGDASEVFRRMAINEEKHGAQLSELRRSLFKDEPRRVDRDLIDEVEAPALNRARLVMSSRKAMELAIESEEKAYDFFANACRVVTDQKVKRLFMDLREEEREHKAMLEKRLPDFPYEPAIDHEDLSEEAGSDPG